MLAAIAIARILLTLIGFSPSSENASHVGGAPRITPLSSTDLLTVCKATDLSLDTSKRPVNVVVFADDAPPLSLAQWPKLKDAKTLTVEGKLAWTITDKQENDLVRIFVAALSPHVLLVATNESYLANVLKQRSHGLKRNFVIDAPIRFWTRVNINDFRRGIMGEGESSFALGTKTIK